MKLSVIGEREALMRLLASFHMDPGSPEDA
jgi:hypothetical protein